MLILGDLSGIQEFLFDVPEQGGHQARQLRARSFRIQLLAECAALRLLRALGLPLDNLLLCTAGRFAIAAPGANTTVEPVRRETAEIGRWLLSCGHGQLRLSVVAQPGEDNQADQYRRALSAIQRAKLRPWRDTATEGKRWIPGNLVLAQVTNREDLTQQDAEIGRVLPAANWALFADMAGDDAAWTGDCVGVQVSLRRGFPSGRLAALLAAASLRGAPGPPGLPASQIIRRRLARYIPVHADGSPVEFIDLAARAEGLPLLGVLKADVDSLGLVIARELDAANDLRPFQRLSNQLEDFFSVQLDEDLGGRWPDLYTVFSGGDDLLLVGPWSTVLDFACHLHRSFASAFRAPGLTLSAGISFIKPKKPIRTAAAQAERLLEQAKTITAFGHTQPKDQIAGFDDIWKWSEHEAILAAGKRLGQWARDGIVPHGSLHTLLELALTRRGQLCGNQRIPPPMATSRLAYHVARNFPKPYSRSPGHVEARRWADQLVREFDAFDSIGNAEVAHLPTIIRYAMLISRKEIDHV